MIYEANKMTDCGQTMNESWNSLVNYQVAIPSAPNNHNNMYQNSLKSAVISLQSMTLKIMKYPVFTVHSSKFQFKC